MPAFAARSAADWRLAAEGALKGVSLDKLTSTTPEGVALGPLHARRTGPRALRGAPGGWKALCRLDHPGADTFNTQAREDLDNGADGLSIVFAGSGVAYGFGLARSDAAILHKAFEGIAFNSGVRFALDVGDFAQAEAVAALVERLGAEPSQADIAFGLDPLGGFARTSAAGPDSATLRAAVADFRRRGFSGPFAAADARCIHDAGGTSAQELAFALAAGLSYLRALEDPAALEFRLTADADQLATLAKFRAMRLLWNRVEQACGLTPAAIRLSASSAWRMMTAVEPYVNVMRAALAAFAAGLGGADSVTLLPFSQAAGLPDAFARRLARNTQAVELREARLGHVADPAAGAGGIEALTEGLCEKAWALFQAFEAAGGLERALERGLVQAEVAAAAAALKRNVARGKAVLTGVNAHPHLESSPAAVLPDAPTVAAACALSALPVCRVSEPFEHLRARAAEAGVRVFLAAIGPVATHSGRLGFARDFFEVGGIPAVVGTGADDLAEAFRRSGATLACLCGSDETYRQNAVDLAKALRSAGAKALYLAGRPGADEASWRAAGIDNFLYVGVDLVAVLEDALRRSGLSRPPSP